MPHAVIRLAVDPATGRREVRIDYEGESDALPSEHEQDHRAVVEKLVKGGLASASREGDEAAAEPTAQSEGQAERGAAKVPG